MVYHAKKLATLTNGTKRESPSLIRDGEVIRCKSENHVPSAPISNAPRLPDVFSQASGDRLEIPGASASGDRSRKVRQSDVPSQENPGQASGDDQSHKIPEWLNFSKKACLVHLTDSHNVAVGTTCS